MPLKSLTRQRSLGFTIVELLIVIVVIAILATISVVAYNGIQKRAQNSQIVAAAADYIEVFRLYKIDNGRYPTPAESGGSYSCLGAYDDGLCANFSTGIGPHSELDNLLSSYRNGASKPSLPTEYMFTNNYNNQWRGVWYYADVPTIRFVQYGLNECPNIGGSSNVTLNWGYSQNIICNIALP